MTAADVKREEEFASLLAACDDALAAGRTPDLLAAADTSTDFQPRLHRNLACMNLVRQVLRGPTSPAFLAAKGADKTSLNVEKAGGHGAHTINWDGAAETKSSSQLPWTQLGRFQIVRELGRGGFGIVYLARDPQLRREVALKVARAEVASRPEQRERFEREARVAAGLEHPNLVPVYEVGEVGPVCFLVSAFCPGLTLTQWLRERTEPVPFRQAARILLALTEAVEHAHERGVVHRDLKPSNVLLQPDKHHHAPRDDSSKPGADGDLDFVPRVTDFGLAKVHEDGDQTQSGAIMGTPHYMAPEQASGKSKDVGPAADGYALGAILYELLTGRPPFVGESTLEVLQQVQHDEPVPPARLRPRVPRDLETICLRCLQKEPRKRYATSAALAVDLRRYLAGETILARPISRVERLLRWAKRNPKVAAMSAALMLLLAAVVIVPTVMALHLDAARDAEAEQRKQAVAHLRTARKAVDEMYTQFAEKFLRHKPHLEQQEREFLEKALVFYQQFAGDEVNDPEMRLERGRALRRVGMLQLWLGQHKESEQSLRDSIALLDRMVADDRSEPRYREALAESCHELDFALTVFMGRHAESEAVIRRAVDLRTQLVREHPGEPAHQANLSASLYSMAETLSAIGELHQAEDAARLSLKLAKDLAAQSDKVEYLFRQAEAVSYLGRHPLPTIERDAMTRESVTIFTKLLARVPGHGYYRNYLIHDRVNLVEIMFREKREQEALDYLRETLVLSARLVEDFPGNGIYLAQKGTTYLQLARRLAAAKKLTEAVAAYGKAAEHWKADLQRFQSLTWYRDSVNATYMEWAGVLVSMKQPEAAAKVYLLNAAKLQKLMDEHSGIGDVALLLSNCYHELGTMLSSEKRSAEAAEAFAKARATRALQVSDPGTAEGRRVQAARLAAKGHAAAAEGRPSEALIALLQAADDLEKLARDYPSKLELRAAIIDSYLSAGNVRRWYMKQPIEAELHYRQALKVAEALHAVFPVNTAYRHQLASVVCSIGAVLENDAARAQEMEDLLRRALTLYENPAEEFPGNAEHRRQAAIAHLTLGNRLLFCAKPDRAAAEKHYRPALAISQALADESDLPGDRHRLAAVCHYLGFLCSHDAKRLAETEKLFKQSLDLYEKLPDGAPPDQVIWGYFHLAHALYQRKKLPEAELTWQRCLGLLAEAHQKQPGSANYLRGLAEAQRSLAGIYAWNAPCRPDRAEIYFKLAIEHYTKLVALPEHTRDDRSALATCRLNLGALIRDSRAAEAEKLLRTALESFVEMMADGSADRNVEHGLTESYLNLALLLTNNKRAGEVDAFFQRVKNLDSKSASWRDRLAWRLANDPPPLRDPPRAVELARKAVELASRDGTCWTTLGAAHFRAGDWKEAIAALEKSHQLGSHRGRFILAMSHWRVGNREQANKCFDEALRWLQQNLPADEELRRFQAEAASLLEESKAGL